MTRVLPGLVIVALVLAVLQLAVSAPEEKVVFLDVGQGDAILFQDGVAQVLFDGGAGMQVLTRLSEEIPFFDRTIDVVVATHPDRDHLEGLLHVLERYEVKLVLLPAVAHTSQLQDEWLRRLEAHIQERAVTVRFAEVGQRITVDDLSVLVLGPDERSLSLSSTNDASILARVELVDHSFLLTGDAEAATERRLVATTPAALLDVDILKAGHHGSKTSTSAELLTAASPASVVVSVGAKNTYGHPSDVVLERLAHIPLLRTDRDGSVRFVRREDTWLLSCSRSSCVQE